MKTFLTNICDKDGRNCKQISELSTGSQITIGGDTGAVCTKEGDDTLKCTTSLASLTPGNGIIKITQGGVEKGSFKLNQSTGLTINLDTGSNITVSGINGNLCTKLSDDSLRCSTDPANLTPGNGKITIKQGTTTIGWFNLNDSESQTLTLATGGNGGSGYTLPAATSGTLGGIKIGYYENGKNYAVKLDLNKNAYVTVPREAGSGGGGGLSLLSGANGKYCKYVEITVGGKSTTGLQCTYDAGGGSSYRSTTTKKNMSGNYVTMLQPSEPYIYSDSLQIVPDNQKAIVRFDYNGVRVGTDASAPTYVGLSVGGPITVGNAYSNNYVYMYATGNAGSPNSHYEISASKRLKIGVDDGAFLYFQSYLNTGTNNNNNGTNYSQYKIGINNDAPRATLDIQGSIRINTSNNSCAIDTCNDQTRGTIVFRGGNFYGCTDNGRLKFTGTATNPSSLPASVNCSVTSIQPVQGGLSR